MVFGWRALRPPRVVFVIGCVYVLQHRCGRVQAEFTSKLTLLSGSIASGEFRKHRSRMAPQDPSALQTLDFIDSINPALPSGPQARQPRTAPRGLKAAQRPPLASANAQSSSWPSLPKARALQPIVDVDLLETAYPSSGRTKTGGLMSYSKLKIGTGGP